MSHEEFPTHDPTMFQPIPCDPYHFTNDTWDRCIAKSVMQQQAQPGLNETSTLICGPGGLPYILCLLRSRHIIQVDLYDTVLDSTARRIKQLQSSSTWEECLDQMIETAQADGHSLEMLLHEYDLMERAKLTTPRSLAKAQESAACIEITPLAGNLLNLGDKITRLCQARGSLLGLAHMTNLAAYIRKGHARGHGVVGKFLSELPLSSSFAVIDSIGIGSFEVSMRLTSLDDYTAGYSDGAHTYDWLSHLADKAAARSLHNEY